MNRVYPSEKEARLQIIEAGKRLYTRNLVAANDGNISAKISENEIWATPTNVSKGFMTEEMLVKLDLDGNVLEGALRPSSEVKMHLEIYRRSPDILSVCHAHPPASTTFAAAGVPLDGAFLQEAVVLLGVIPVAPYKVPGSEELAAGAAAFCPEYNGVLLEHHGLVTWGDSVSQALHRLEGVEFYATITMNLRAAGLERPMTNRQVDELIKLRPAWGITGGGVPKGREENK